MVNGILSGARCVVIGSAPIATQLVIADEEIVVAVNGGISSYPRCDVWVLNSRNIAAESWSPNQRRLSTTFLEQGKGRTISRAVFLTKHDDADKWTLAFLKKQGTTVLSAIAINNEERRRLEALAGARSPDMQKHALSAGLFAVAWCFFEGAATVRLEGISWEPGYAYLPGEQFITRGHLAGDKQALGRLMARYPERLTHQIGEIVMAKTTVNKSERARTTRPTRPSAEAIKASGAARRSARGMLTPAAERERLKEAKAAAGAREKTEARARSGGLLVRATEKTFYDNKRRRVGDEFVLREASNFRESCMEWVDPNAPKPAPGEASPAHDARIPRRLAPDGVTPLEDVPARGRAPRPDNPLGID